MNESHRPPPEVTREQLGDANNSARNLIDGLHKGQDLDPALKEQLLTLLAVSENSEQLDSIELSPEQKKILSMAWETAEKSYMPKETPEAKERIDAITASLLADLEFVGIQGKADRQREDFSTYKVWSKEEVNLDILNERIIQSLPDELKVTDEKSRTRALVPNTEYIEGRAMLLFDNPDAIDKKIAVYSIDNPVRDAAGRSVAGSNGSKLTFAIDKNNSNFKLMMEGKLEPKEFITAVLHAGVVLNPKTIHMVKIFSAGSGGASLADYGSHTMVDYPDKPGVGQVKNFDTPGAFAKDLNKSLQARHYSLVGNDIPGIRESEHRGQFSSFIETGSEPR